MDNTYLRVGEDKVRIDILDPLQLEINYSLKNIKNYGKSNASFTKSLTVLRTEQSEKVFKSLHNVNIVNGYTIDKKVKCEIIKNGLVILSGSLQVVNIYPETYEVIVSTDNLSLFDVIGDKYITGNENVSDNIVFTDNLNSHLLDPSVVRNYINAGPSDNGYGIFYPVIDYSNTLVAPESISNNYPLLPAVAAFQIFDKIITNAGFTYTLSKDISILIQKMYIPYNTDYFKENYTYAQYYVGTPTEPMYTNRVYLWKNAIIGVPSYAVPLWKIKSQFTVDPSTGFDYFKNASDGYMVAGLDLPCGTINIDASLMFMTSQNNPGSAINAVFYTYDYDNIITKRFEETLSSTTKNTFVYINKSFKFNNFKESKLWLSIIPEDSSSLDPIHSYVYVDGRMYVHNHIALHAADSKVTLTLNNSIYCKKTININDILPNKYKQKDFISDIFKMFNAYVVDKDTKLYIKSYEDFYNYGKTLDWTNKVKTDNVKITSLKNDFASIIKLRYKSDGNKYDEDFKSKYGYSFGTKEIINDSEFTNEENIIELSCAPTIMKKLANEYNPIIEDASFYLEPDGLPPEMTNQVFFNWYDHFDPGDTILGVHRENYYEGLAYGQRYRNVRSNTKWTTRITVGNWVSIRPSSGYGDASIKITVLANPTNSVRTARIDFFKGENQITPEVGIDIFQTPYLKDWVF